MATNFVQPGESMTLTAPEGGVVSGGTYKIGQLIGFAAADAEAGDSFVLVVTGVWTVTKVGSQAWTEGALVYFNGTAWTTTSAGGTLGGVAAESVGATAEETTGKVRLNGTAVAAT